MCSPRTLLTIPWWTNTYGSVTSTPATLTVNAATPGAVVAWGAGETNTGVDPQYGQSIVPVGLGEVTAVTAGCLSRGGLENRWHGGGVG